MENKPDILLATINAKWIHPSLALRLLKANLGLLEERCRIIEFALRQPLREKTAPILAAGPRILGLSVSIWNHAATLELLQALRQEYGGRPLPIIVLGGPEVSCLPPDAAIFQYADYCIRGEGEIAFGNLCAHILNTGGGTEKQIDNTPQSGGQGKTVFVNDWPHEVDINAIQSGYRLYTEEDVQKKLIYVEASRGCPFHCEFCMSSFSPGAGETAHNPVREFPLEPFLAQMDELVRRGARTLKFLDRSFNLNIERARRIMEFFLGKIGERELSGRPLTVHFEMVPSRFPPELMETLARFPTGSLRLEIGIQTLDRETAARIGRPIIPDRELETLGRLREQTHAIIHADLIAGLPGEDTASFGRGFDRLWTALSPYRNAVSGAVEIQPGILKLLPGAPISRHSTQFGMRYNPAPPYELIESAAIPARDMERLKNFARFWELIVNRSLLDTASLAALFPPGQSAFNHCMSLADSLQSHFGRNWGIDKNQLREAVLNSGQF